MLNVIVAIRLDNTSLSQNYPGKRRVDDEDYMSGHHQYKITDYCFGNMILAVEKVGMNSRGVQNLKAYFPSRL